MQLTVLRRVLPFLVLPVLAGITSLSASGQTMKNEPDGFGKAKFGMSEPDVLALYPKMQQVVMPTPPPEQAPKEPLPFTLTTYTLDNQSFGPLKQCKVTMRTRTRGIAKKRGVLSSSHDLCSSRRKAM